MAALDFHAAQRQSTRLSPRLQHAVRLLQMSAMDFAATLRDTLGANPFLEAEEVDDAGDPMPADTAEVADAEAPFDPADGDAWHPASGPAQPPAGDGAVSALDLLAVEPSLTAHLHTQLNLLRLPARERLLARNIVESLDDDGYLRTPLDELLAISELDPAVCIAELHTALGRVQSLDPAGVAARSVAECLQLQLPSIACPAQRALAATLVAEHLPALAARDTGALARRLGLPLPAVSAACERIRRLDPRPGWRFGAPGAGYVVPDVVARKVRGQWRVQLNPATVPRVRLNQTYADLFRQHRSAQHRALAGHLQEARWTVRNVEQRFSTILDVAQAIVRRQQHFLEFGAMAMKPLGLAEIAAEVGVHESTVSRVTSNKYIATPAGTFELKYFFSRVMVSANGSACSGTAIRGLVEDLIGSETAAAPLSDAEIARRLAQQGLTVARRTVTKYRQMLRIEAAPQRRRA